MIYRFRVDGYRCKLIPFDSYTQKYVLERDLQITKFVDYSTLEQALIEAEEKKDVRSAISHILNKIVGGEK